MGGKRTSTRYPPGPAAVPQALERRSEETISAAAFDRLPSRVISARLERLRGETDHLALLDTTRITVSAPIYRESPDNGGYE
jgi:hypothetical protein